MQVDAFSNLNWSSLAVPLWLYAELNDSPPLLPFPSSYMPGHVETILDLIWQTPVKQGPLL